jgi:predicted SprT family Zn-dependent metalloprotease
VKIRIINKSRWRTRELKKLVTAVKRQWFDPSDKSYRIAFRDCGRRYGTSHGQAWWTIGYCEVFIPLDGRVDVWLARVIRHELLHLVQQAGGRAWEIKERETDRRWCRDDALAAKIPWVNEIKLVPKRKKPVRKRRILYHAPF